jgi:hypothetical protein
MNDAGRDANPTWRGKDTTRPQEFEEAAKWWFSTRPCGWTLDMHLAHPTVRCATPKERGLAMLVANWIAYDRARFDQGKGRN